MGTSIVKEIIAGKNGNAGTLTVAECEQGLIFTAEMNYFGISIGGLNARSKPNNQSFHNKGAIQ